MLECRRTGSPIQLEMPIESRYFTYCAVHIKDNLFAYHECPKLLHYCYIGKDITDYITLQRDLQHSRDKLSEMVDERTRQLHQALQVKSNFLATMSHGKN